MSSRTAKFGIVAVIMVPALVFLASCEIPQSVRIKASPTLQIPVPLGDGMDNSFIRQYTDVEEIRKKMKGQDEQGKVISIYDYKSEALMAHFGIDKMEENNPVQTYLITYPLFDMSLDFDEYLNGTLLNTGKSRVPQIEISTAMSNMVANTVDRVSQAGNPAGNDLPYSNWIDPFLGNSPKIDLGDMKSLLSDITFNPDTSFSIRINGKGDPYELQKAIRIRVPQLKIGGKTDANEASWVKGELAENNTRLVFRSTGISSNVPLLLLSAGTSAEKEASGRVDIYIKLANKIGAGTYDSELNFNWYSANVKPNDASKQTGEFQGFDLGSYLTSFGDSAKFERVPGYLYMNTPSNIGNFKVEIDGIGAVAPGDSFPLKKTDITPEKDKEGKLPSWFDREPTSEYDFTMLVNGGGTIKYKITPPSTVTLFHSDIENERDPKITANLAVLLPMVFKFTGEPDRVGDGYYFPVNFQGLDDFLGTGGTGTGNSSVMEKIDEELGEGSINSLTLRLRDIDNNITSPIYLAIMTDSTIKNPGPGDWQIVKIAPGAEGKDIDINNGSFTQFPRIKFYVKDEGGSGRLYIQSQGDKDSAAFSVKISVIADISLDKPIDL
jgi:hypothetical protein